MSLKINIAIVEDEQLFRIGISYILTRDKNINIVFEASNGNELLEYLHKNEISPDIILMDIKMPELNGVETTRIIKREFNDISVIALTTYSSKPFIRNMINVGSCAYLIKNSPPEKVIHTIKQVYYNGFYYDSHILKVLNRESITTNDKLLKCVFDKNFLTIREKEILELICQQNTTKEIGRKLFISSRTVDIHRKNLLNKTRVKNSAGLVVFALTNNLIEPRL